MHRYPPLTLTLIALLALALATPTPVTAQATEADADAPPDYSLAPIWKDGQTARYEVRTTRVTTTEAAGEKLVRTIDVEASFQWTVTDAAEAGGGEAEMLIEDIKLTFTANGESALVTADRAPEGYDSVRNFIKAFIDARIIVEVDQTGRVTAVDGWKAIKNNGGEATQSLVENDFLEMATELAPLAGGGKADTVGDTWTEKFDFSHEYGDLALTSTYTFQAVEPIAEIPVALVNRESEIDFKFDGEATGMDREVPGLTINWKLAEAGQTSQILFDLTRHEVVGMNIDRNIDFEITATFRGNANARTIRERISTQTLRIEED